MSNWCGYVLLDEYVLFVESAKVVYTGGDPYGGEYKVDPDFVGTTLKTRNKVLQDDVVVNPIEVSRVSNPSGGKTVYIGGTVNG